jgi:alanine racemase
MGYTVSEITKALKSKIYPAGDFEDSAINSLLIDSRSFIEPLGTLFIALVTSKNDGHRYIPELYQKGVRLFMVNEEHQDFKSFEDAIFIIVKDTLEGLQQLAKWHREHFKLSVLAVTGSNGKTIVKEWLYQLLSPDKNIVRSPRSYNSQVGVPLSVWQLDKTDELAIFEAGISQPGEMETLQEIIQPTIGIFTNIGEAHSLNFKNQEQKVIEKLKLFKEVETLIYCKDHTVIDEAIKDSKAIYKTKLFTWSKKANTDLHIQKIKVIGNETDITASYSKKIISIKIPFTDEASIENAIHCWAYLLLTGIANDVIWERMGHLQPVAMRMEMIMGANNCTVINDVYNSDINSIAVALDFLNQQKQHKNKTLILSDIIQSGSNDKELYNNVAAIVKAKKPTRIIGIGPKLSSYSGLFNTEKHFFSSTEEFLSHFGDFAFRDEAILVKGARSFEFEKISRLLQHKAHETVLQINLDALVHNLNYFKSRLKPSTKIMAMVKAFSYGSGSYEIANTLQFHKADYLAVAYADEGVELRRAGISLPIMVMNPEPGSFDNIIRFQLEPEVYNFRTLEMVLRALKINGATQPLPIHIKLDTGMHRLGFNENDISNLMKLLQQEILIKVQSVFSHLAASDAEQHKDFTLDQVKRFRNMSDKIVNELHYPILCHILNSAGIVRFPEAQFDMVRLGIGLYGVAANDEEQKKLENVSTLKTTISQINLLKKGETVGYNRRGVLERDSVIATVAIGYADGYGRELGNGKGQMMVNGKMAPVIGDVCMDMCMIDITGIEAKEGDEVVIFNDIHSLLQMAKSTNTIPYEVLTSLSQRVKRIYIHE